MRGKVGRVKPVPLPYKIGLIIQRQTNKHNVVPSVCFLGATLRDLLLLETWRVVLGFCSFLQIQNGLQDLKTKSTKQVG